MLNSYGGRKLRKRKISYGVQGWASALANPLPYPYSIWQSTPTIKQEIGLCKESDLFALLFQPEKMSNSRQTSALLQWGLVSALNL